MREFIGVMISVLGIGGLLLGQIILRCLQTYRLAYKLCHPESKEQILKITEYGAVDYFDFYTKDGIRLNGIDVKPKGVIKGTILLCHYLGGTKEMVVNMMESLLREGYRLLSFDFRNHGKSQCDNRIKFSLICDFEAFYKSVCARTDSKQFGIAGFSMGCTAALYGLSKYSEIKVALIDSGPLLSVKQYFSYVLKQANIKNKFMRFFFLWFYVHVAGFRKMRNQSLSCLKDIALSNVNQCAKIQYIHGQRDNIIPFSDAKEAYEITKKISDLWMVKGSRHLTNLMVCPKEYEEKIKELFSVLSRI